MWAAGMSEKSKVTRNIFTTVWLGLNKVWGQDSPGRSGLWVDLPLFPHQLPLGYRSLTHHLDGAHLGHTVTLPPQRIQVHDTLGRS